MGVEKHHFDTLTKHSRSAAALFLRDPSPTFIRHRVDDSFGFSGLNRLLVKRCGGALATPDVSCLGTGFS